MKLRELLNDQVQSIREVLIGKEIDVLGKRMLLLSLREVEEMDDGEPERVTKLAALYEENLDLESSWFDDDDDEEEDEYEEQTNRQWLIEMMDEDVEISESDVDAFVVNGVRYEVFENEMSYLEAPMYEEGMLARHFVEQGIIPDIWLEKKLDELCIAEYTVDPAIFRVDWNADILNISVEMSEPTQEFLVGKVIKCTCGHYDVPKEFSIKNPQGQDTTVRIHGVYPHDIWSDAACLEMDFSELEACCERDERLLVVEYSVDEALDLEFYTKEYLDASADDDDDECRAIGLILNSSNQVSVIDVVPAGFDGEVEIELLSYTV